MTKWWRRLRCSFCYRTEDQVAKLVAGPRVYICDACARRAIELMAGSPPRTPARWGAVESSDGRP
jgi:ATP-dependent protease Clp ATPase subunit